MADAGSKKWTGQKLLPNVLVDLYVADKVLANCYHSGSENLETIVPIDIYHVCHFYRYKCLHDRVDVDSDR